MPANLELLQDGPPDAPWTIALAHGAGAGMRSDYLEYFAAGLAARGLRVVRFEFPYMAARTQGGKKGPPDREPVLRDTWKRVVERWGADRLVLAGKSMGGRIASLVADEVGARGLVCLGYPFHPVGKPTQLRTAHLAALRTPTLILQGTRDPFGTQAKSPAILVPGHRAPLAARRQPRFHAAKSLRANANAELGRGDRHDGDVRPRAGLGVRAFTHVHNHGCVLDRNSRPCPQLFSRVFGIPRLIRALERGKAVYPREETFIKWSDLMHEGVAELNTREVADERGVECLQGDRMRKVPLKSGDGRACPAFTGKSSRNGHGDCYKGSQSQGAMVETVSLQPFILFRQPPRRDVSHRLIATPPRQRGVSVQGGFARVDFCCRPPGGAVEAHFSSSVIVPFRGRAAGLVSSHCSRGPLPHRGQAFKARVP